MDERLSNLSIYELFGLEVDSQVPVLTDALLALESDPTQFDHLNTAMRCVHSLKGAARMVALNAGVGVTHAMEECLVAGQEGRIVIRRNHIDTLLRGVDFLQHMAQTAATQSEQWSQEDAPQALAYIAELHQVMAHTHVAAARPDMALLEQAESIGTAPPAPLRETLADDRMLRVTADHLNQILGLSGELLIGSRWLKPFSQSLLQLKHQQTASRKALEGLESALLEHALPESVSSALERAKASAEANDQLLAQEMVQLDQFSQRQTQLAQRLYDAALASRMRPFRDGVTAFARMVRDLGNTLDKQVSLQVSGQSTLVDRDILAKLEAPLTHLLRNAIDHAIESPEQRLRDGKPAEAVLHLNAVHQAGMLWISLRDDGRGIALEPLRARIVAKQLVSRDMATHLTQEELLEFLFLPGFSMRDEVSETSGRGVGLDVVQNMVKQVRGVVSIESEVGRGTCLRLRLPITTSVVRVLLVEVAGEPYAFPLASISAALLLDPKQIEHIEGRPHFTRNGVQVGLVSARQIFLKPSQRLTDVLPVVVLGDALCPFGVIVDRLMGERDLVVQALDARLGKVKDVAAAALMEDGSPVLILDVEDMMQSVGKLVAAGPMQTVIDATPAPKAVQRKRVLLVDDSLTVRELERKLLISRGYEVEVAIDGVDGWNAARTGQFDLIISDIDMPRMDGIALLTRVREHPQLRATPVVIVSYKDREEDRQRGLEAGADYYLTKSSFHDDSLIGAVIDLIGEPDA